MVLFVGCASAPPRSLRPYISDMGAISIGMHQVFGLVYLSTHSYLPGDKKTSYGKTDYYDCTRNHRVGLRLPADNSVSAHQARSAATYACKAWLAIEEYFGSSPQIASLDITLVPEEIQFNAGESSFGKRINIKLALRHYRTRGDLFFERYMVRILAHEISHVYMNLDSTQRKNEEFVASLLESCAELSVIGSANGDITYEQSNRAMRDIASNESAGITKSVKGGLSARSAIEALGIMLPVSRSEPDAMRLLDMCRKITHPHLE